MFDSHYHHLGLTSQIVTYLMTPLLGKGHHLFCDRFYSSVELARELHTKKTGFTGTLNRNRKHLPSVARSKSFTIPTHAYKAWRHNNLLVMAWRDKHKAPTLLLSSVYSTATTVVRSRNPTTAAVNKPVLVHSYNQSMNGVDLADQFSTYYNFVRRTLKCWRKLMFWLLDVSIVNSYLLYKQAHRERCLPHVHFRCKLV